MSDREGSRSRSPSPAPGRSPAAESGSAKSRSASRSRSPSVKRSRSRSRRRSYSKSRSRSPYQRRRRSRSRSRSPYGRRSDSYRGRSNGRRNRSHSRSPMSRRRRHIGNRDNPDASNCLGVFGLSLYTQERDIRDVFGRYGPLDEANIVYDHHSGRSRGFGFVYFKDIDDAIEAKEKCAGMEIDGRRIRVDFSITKRAHTPTPGIYLGKPTGGGYRERPPRRSPSPYYRRGGRYSRSRSRSYSPRRY